jgi:hypothetical protein
MMISSNIFLKRNKKKNDLLKRPIRDVKVWFQLVCIFTSTLSFNTGISVLSGD